MQQSSGQDAFNWRQFLEQSEEERRSAAAASLRSRVTDNPLIASANDIPLDEVIINIGDEDNEWDANANNNNEEAGEDEEEEV